MIFPTSINWWSHRFPMSDEFQVSSQIPSPPRHIVSRWRRSGKKTQKQSDSRSWGWGVFLRRVIQYLTNIFQERYHNTTPYTYTYIYIYIQIYIYISIQGYMYYIYVCSNPLHPQDSLGFMIDISHFGRCAEAGVVWASSMAVSTAKALKPRTVFSALFGVTDRYVEWKNTGKPNDNIQ